MAPGGRDLRFLLLLAERWPCHNWFVGKMNFASLAQFWVELGFLFCPIFLFSLSLSLSLG